MRIKIKPCSTVGNAFMVVQTTKLGRETKLAIGLTEFEAKSAAIAYRQSGGIFFARKGV